MLDALLPPAENAQFLGTETTEAVFLTSLTWSLGGGLLEDGRIVFDGFVKRIASLPQNPAEGSVVKPGLNSISSTMKSSKRQLWTLYKLCNRQFSFFFFFFISFMVYRGTNYLVTVSSRLKRH